MRRYALPLAIATLLSPLLLVSGQTPDEPRPAARAGPTARPTPATRAIRTR